MTLQVCISIDLDNYQDYQSLIGTPTEGEAPTFYTEAIPRFLDLFDESGIKATFFAIGRDLGRTENRNVLQEIVARGHEVGNHSFSHPYNFRQLSRAQKAEEIDQGHAAIADVLGTPPRGFRTPSCEIDLEILELLGERGYLYDSSVFPSPLMWFFMLYGKLFVKRQDYSLGSPMAALAPTQPYWPSRQALHRRRKSTIDAQNQVLEIPFSTLSPLRVPFYSTFLQVLGRRFVDGMVTGYGSNKPCLHALFHQIEFADFEGTELGTAMEATPALGASFPKRNRYMVHVMKRLARAGECIPLRDLALAHASADSGESGS